MKNYKSYFRVIIQKIKMGHKQAVIYRADYTLRIVRAILDVTIAYVIISVFYFQAPTIVGWNKWEALLVFAFYHLIRAAVMMIFGDGVIGLYYDIIRGSLDRYLVQPIDSQFSASVQVPFITNIFRFLFGLAVFFIALSNLSLSLSIKTLIFTAIASLSAVVIYYSILFTIAVLSFWTFSGELGELMHTVASITRFPADFFSRGIKTLMHLFPLAFISTVPAKALLGRDYKLAFISPLVAFLALLLTRKLWYLGLKSYQSASS